MKGPTKRPPRDAPLATFDETPAAYFLGARGSLPDLKVSLSRVAAVEKSTGVRVHLVDASRVCGAVHLASALLHARRAHERGRGRARDLKVELMMYLVGERQISRAIESAGVKRGTKAVGVAVEGGHKSAVRAASELLPALALERDDAALVATAAKAKALKAAGAGKDAAEWEALALEVTAFVDLD